MNRILDAAHFAASKHATQRRKDADATPYINHPLEVAFHLHSVGQVEDVDVLVAAVLHDTLEDTDTSPEELRERFGDQVLSLVLECTDDKSLPQHVRKQQQIEHASDLSPGAALIKLGDKTCNLGSILRSPPADWSSARKLAYFEWASAVIGGLPKVNAAMESAVRDILREGILRFSRVNE